MMKFAVTQIVNKKVNKSVQDRLRRERISKSVEALRELILGPSIEHAKIGKEDILKLTVQYIRKQKELKKNVVEDQETTGAVYKREKNELIPSSGNDLSKLSVCSTNEQVQTKETRILEKDVRSESAKLSYDENTTDEPSSIQSQSHFATSALFGNSIQDSRYNSVKRTPFRELNFNNTEQQGKQTIWRPW